MALVSTSGHWSRNDGSSVVEGEGTLYHRHTKDAAYAVLNSSEGETIIACNQVVIRDIELPAPIPAILSKGQCVCHNLNALEGNQFIHSLIVPSSAKVGYLDH